MVSLSLVDYSTLFWARVRAVSTERLQLQFRIKPNMTQPRDPTNDFVEFVQVWRDGAVCDYLEGVVMYDSRNGSKYILRHISNGFAPVFYS